MRRACAGVVFLLLFGANLHGMAPTVTEDDSGELAGAVATLGIAHPPGYPLYVLGGHAVDSLIPWATPVYRANLFSALSGAAVPALLLLLLPVKLESNEEVVAAAAALLTLGLAAPYRRMALTTEVYLPALLLLPPLLAHLPALERPEPRVLAFLGFLAGLLTLGHYLLLFPLLGLAVVFFAHHRRFEARWLWTLAGFALGLSPVLFLWARAQGQPAFSWEDPRTFGRFLDVVARHRYGALKLAQGGAPLLSPGQVVDKLRFFTLEMGGALGAAGTLGVVLALVKRRDFTAWSLLAMSVLAGPVYLVAANVPLNSGTQDLLERFLFLPAVLLAVLAALGWERTLGAMRRWRGTTALVLGALAVARVSPALADTHREDWTFYDGWRNLMRNAPPRAALIFDRADESEFATAYYHRVEGRRPDILFRDANAGVSVSAYGDDYYRVWGKPRLERRTEAEREFMRTAGRPVFYASHDFEMLPVKRRFAGLLFETLKAPAPAALRVSQRDYAPFLVRRLHHSVDYGARARNLLLGNSRLMLQHQLSRRDRDAAWREAYALFALGGRRVLDSLAFEFQRAGYLDQAGNLYTKAIRLMGPTSLRLLNLGVAMEAKGLPDKAEMLYLQAVSIEPDNLRARKNIAALNWKRKKWREVVAQYEQILARSPDDYDAKRYLPEARARLGGAK